MSYRNGLGKFAYLKSLEGRVNKEIDFESGKIKLTGYRPDGSGIELSYTEGCTANGVEIYTIYKNGTKRALHMQGSAKRHMVIRENSSIHVNELILQLDGMSNGIPPKDGDYNHLYMCSYTSEERFSILAGEIVCHENNEIHKFTCQKIKRLTGYKVSMSAIGEGIELFAPAEEFSREAVRVAEELGYLDIIEDTTPNAEE